MSTGTDAPLIGEALPVDLMNTIWADHGEVHDTLADPAAAAGWLHAVRDRLAPDSPDVATWLDSLGATATAPGPVTARLRLLRDAVRRLAADLTADPRTAWSSPIPDRAGALDEIARAAAAAPAWSTLDWPADGPPARRRHSTADPGPTAVALLAVQAVDFFAADRAPDLRGCLAPGCVLYFTKQHPRREWCSAGCGNRARVARHYRRHHAGAAGQD